MDLCNPKFLTVLEHNYQNASDMFLHYCTKFLEHNYQNASNRDAKTYVSIIVRCVYFLHTCNTLYAVHVLVTLPPKLIYREQRGKINTFFIFSYKKPARYRATRPAMCLRAVWTCSTPKIRITLFFSHLKLDLAYTNYYNSCCSSLTEIITQQN